VLCFCFCGALCGTARAIHHGINSAEEWAGRHSTVVTGTNELWSGLGTAAELNSSSTEIDVCPFNLQLRWMYCSTAGTGSGTVESCRRRTADVHEYHHAAGKERESNDRIHKYKAIFPAVLGHWHAASCSCTPARRGSARDTVVAVAAPRLADLVHTRARSAQSAVALGAARPPASRAPRCAGRRRWRRAARQPHSPR
jgi:hypothetical protein